MISNYQHGNMFLSCFMLPSKCFQLRVGMISVWQQIGCRRDKWIYLQVGLFIYFSNSALSVFPFI
jgi:hypothetical protein